MPKPPLYPVIDYFRQSRKTCEWKSERQGRRRCWNSQFRVNFKLLLRTCFFMFLIPRTFRKANTNDFDGNFQYLLLEITQNFRVSDLPSQYRKIYPKIPQIFWKCDYIECTVKKSNFCKKRHPMDMFSLMDDTDLPDYYCTTLWIWMTCDHIPYGVFKLWYAKSQLRGFSFWEKKHSIVSATLTFIVFQNWLVDFKEINWKEKF